jgi:hypothetical protein
LRVTAAAELRQLSLNTLAAFRRSWLELIARASIFSLKANVVFPLLVLRIQDPLVCFAGVANHLARLSRW